MSALRASVVLSLTMVAGMSSLAVAPATSRQPSSSPYVFVSVPDFPNQDVADVTSGGTLWEPGDPNSTNASYEHSIAVVLSDIAARAPQSVLVAGDLVAGYWDQDTDHTGIFGPLSTTAEKSGAVRMAADLYFRHWAELFSDLHVPVHAAVGDHDIGDDPWSVSTDTFKHDHLWLWREYWAKYLTDTGTRYHLHPTGTAFDRTAYATYLTRQVLLVSVDEFLATPNDVVVSLGTRQLRWLRGVLSTARTHRVPWIIVQGHAPVLGPVRKSHTSDLHFEQRAASPFWRTMKRYGVDLYLCGEVHETTALRDAVTQISHGGLMYTGTERYLVGRIDGRTLTLEDRVLHATTDTTDTLWQTDRRHAPIGLYYSPGSVVDGRMTLTAGGRVLSRSGVLGVYRR